jgi:hypothetical protein
MISIKDIQDKLTVRKDRMVQLPKPNKYTQKTAYQMMAVELESNITDMESSNSNQQNELNEYLNYTTKVSQVRQTSFDSHSNSQYHTNNQGNAQKENHLDRTVQIRSSNKLIYNDTDIIDIPDFLLDFFTTNKLDNKNYYLYGIKNNNSFFTSLILLSEPDYIIKSRSEKMGYITSFKKELAINLDSYYKKFNYKKSKFIKSTITDELINKNVCSYPQQVVGVDYINIDICIVDIDTKTYLFIDTIQQDINKESFSIIIKLGGYYLPLMSSNGNHLFDISCMDFIKTINTEHDFSEASFNKRTFDVVKTKLKALSSYKITDLQELAASNNINIRKDDGKKKIKKELYDELVCRL